MPDRGERRFPRIEEALDRIEGSPCPHHGRDRRQRGELGRLILSLGGGHRRLADQDQLHRRARRAQAFVSYR